MDEHRTPRRVWPAVVIAAAVGAFWFGLDPRGPAARVADAAVDVLDPALEVPATRERREALRAELDRLTQLQTASFEVRGQFEPREQFALPRGLALSVMSGPSTTTERPESAPPRWIALLTDERGPSGEACAVSLNTEVAYVAGIPLKRSGRVRCSWDLATRLNRLW